MHRDNKTERVEERQNDDFTLFTRIDYMVNISKRINVFIDRTARELDRFAFSGGAATVQIYGDVFAVAAEPVNIFSGISFPKICLYS